MLFNSYLFIFAYLPLTVLLHQILIRFGTGRLAAGFLAAASILFYGYWEWRFVPILAVSIVANYLLARAIAAVPRRTPRRLVAGCGIALNLAALGYFKYANFFLANWNDAFDTDFVVRVALPLGISFFTFQQIAYLADAARETADANAGRDASRDAGRGRGGADRDFVRYALFVSFFPQLIAGPIVHHGEMMPQFARSKPSAWRRNLAVGSTIFILGLAKKVLLADNLAPLASPVFDAAAAGGAVSMADAWLAALAYSFQIYFDFSGYSDMAVGLGWMFGVRLPMNFASPYKARSIVDFWRRWHLTLSRFLRDYLYIPLGGRSRRYVNVFVTMLLGGIWHGAGWTFVLWGALHGMMIMVSQARASRFGQPAPAGIRRVRAVALTFLLVMIAWVPFRAANMEAVTTMYGAMAGLSDAAGAAFLAEAKQRHLAALAGALLIAFFAPNTAVFMRRVRPVLALPGYPASRVGAGAGRDAGGTAALAWAPSPVWAVAMALLFAFVVLNLNAPSEFIYFQF